VASCNAIPLWLSLRQVFQLPEDMSWKCITLAERFEGFGQRAGLHFVACDPTCGGGLLIGSL